MGNIRSHLGDIRSHVRRSIRNWNVENRAMRSIERTDRPAPPRYPTEARILAQRRAQEPPCQGSAVPGLESEKNVQLDNWLRKVHVSSHDISLMPPKQEQEEDSAPPVESDPRYATSLRPLPERQDPNAPETELAYDPPVRVIPGKVTLNQVLEIIAAHQQDPKVNTAPFLAAQFKLLEADTEALLKYFGVYALYLPKTAKQESKVLSTRDFFRGIDAETARISQSPVELGPWSRGPIVYQKWKEATKQVIRDEAEMPKETWISERRKGKKFDPSEDGRKKGS